MAHALPRLLSLEDVALRLQTIFPPEFPDRPILVGDMAARAIFVALYGGFVEGTGRYFRPSTIIRFSKALAESTGDDERLAWVLECQTPGYKAVDPWYAENTRETLRDDFLRNRAIPMGIFSKKEGVPPTSPAPIYCITPHFADLFAPALLGEALEAAVKRWQQRHLDPMTLKRMRLIAQGAKAKEGQVTVTLPTTGKTLRLAPGEASAITRDVCEVLGPALLTIPVVVHASISDQKVFRELAGEAEAIGLKIDTSAELPDVVIADIGRDTGMQLAFIEVVHSDGPITELRRDGLLAIAAEAGIASEHVILVTAFEDRNSPAFKKRFSELARGSLVWFRTEPDIIVRIDALRE